MTRSIFTRIFKLSVFSLFSFSLLLIGFFAYNIHKTNSLIFGPAADSLHTMEKVYWSAILLAQTNNLTTPNKPVGEDIHFKVKFGESAHSVSQRLGDYGLINNPDSFRSYLIYSGLDTRIQAGDYLLNPMMTPIEIARKIQDATPDFVDFSVFAGWRSEEIALAIPYSGLDFSQEDFLDIVQANDAEGYLLPGTYTFPRDSSAVLMITTLLNEFDSRLTEEMKSGFTTQGLSIQEAVILASIIEREAVIEDEMPLIASVFLNRLNSAMTLNADPTVQFALGYNISQGTWWTNPLSLDDLKINSPYNTYLYPGLPPGPICNPGTKALKAVAFPAQTPYYYFRVLCNGSSRHNFSETFAEHINNACP